MANMASLHRQICVFMEDMIFCSANMVSLHGVFSANMVFCHGRNGVLLGGNSFLSNKDVFSSKMTFFFSTENKSLTRSDGFFLGVYDVLLDKTKKLNKSYWTFSYLVKWHFLLLIERVL